MTSNYWQNYWRKQRLSRRRLLGTASAAGVGVAGISLVGCGNDDDDTNGAAPGNGDDANGANGENGDFEENATLRATIASDVGDLDPQSVSGTGGGNWPNYETHFSPALTIHPETNEIVGFAADWEWTDDTELTFTTREGIEFTNGEPFNAEVLAFNIERTLGRADYNPDYQSGHASNFASIDQLEVTDERTLRATLNSIDVALPFQFATLFGMPIVPMNYIIENGDQEFSSNPVGLGPFEFVSHSADTEIVSRRFDNFFQGRDAELGPRLPYIQELVQRVMPEAGASLSALETGEVDVVSNVPADLAEAWEGRSGFQVHYLAGEQPMHIHFNTMVDSDATGSDGENPWRDRRVREAANLAVDLDTIIDTILTGREQKSFGTTQRAFGFPEELRDNAWGYDPDRARELLAEAGYEDGFDTLFTGPSERWPNTRPVMEAVASYLAEVGIRSDIQISQYSTWISEVQSQELPGMWFMGLASGADPAANFLFGYHSEGAYCSSYDPESGLDELIEESLETVDVDERNALNAEIIRTHYENASWLYLYEPVSVAVATDRMVWDPYWPVLDRPEYWNVRMRA